VTARVTYGKAGDEALAMADEMHADLIVLGRHGAGLVRPLVLGTTVNTVLHGAKCPVLVVVDDDR
jgi:universal stress protein A